ncbi:MAG: hypothetical protein HGGPFJEG_02563 [Ignavibacteria bacterium]|nr:hypothetical protein [Ignavibacteria bacterium]
MKNLINILIILLTSILLPNNEIFSFPDELITGELIITNNSSSNLKISVYPIGAHFNKNKKYSLISITYPTRKILAGAKDSLLYNEKFTLDHDAAQGTGADSIIGYGRYRVVFYLFNSNNQLYDSIEYCDVDYSDYDYPYGGNNDITFYYHSNDSITFEFNGGTINKIQDADRYLKIWDQYGGLVHKTQNKNGFTSDTEYVYIPINAVSYGAVSHINPGDIFVNFNIIDNLYSNIAEDIIVKKKAYLTVNQGIDFEMITPQSGHTKLIIEDSSFLKLSTNSKIIINNENRLILKNKSTLIILSGSELRFKPYSIFCNYGAKIIGSGSIIFEKGYHQYDCNQLSDFLFQDSAKLILEDSAIVNLPNNITLHIKGNTTSLILKPGSKLLFGENSGIVCDQGGKVIANNATFASSDSTKKWNGISLSGLSQDTIKNCSIKNAAYGISISDKYDAEDTGIDYSAEISGCTFINKTNYVLNSALYIAGSNNVLIMNNSVSSSALEKGYTHGIYAEYCPEGVLNIIGNEISGTGNGMTLIGCSPFAAQNALAGNEYSECGMFLDNSNGTFEYNEISDFYCSYFSYYSSPDLLKNVFDNYYDDNLWLSSSSVPVMHPLINGGSVYWYAGDNLIKGSPSNSGIIFDDDACPLMNYGYNRFIMTNNDYYIQGSNPSGYGREFYVIQNYWGGIPDTNKFYVANADLIYSPYDDNSQTARQTNTEDKFDIGFGLYDTVFSYEPDNPNSAQELYLEAYQKEYAGEFSQAIDIYKEIVEDYKDSSYTSSCLPRIFGCYEKNNTSQSGYGLLESYYESISEDTSYSEIQRNIAEEFMIKSKVKQNNIEEAISNYDEIYTQNMNTEKACMRL